MGLFIESSALAEWAAGKFAGRLPTHAFKVRLNESNHIEWVDASGSEEIVYDDEPMTDGWRRFVSDFLGILPVEGEI